MPSFLKTHLTLRRRSKASIVETPSASASASGNSSEAGNDEQTHGQVHPMSKSSSTLNSYWGNNTNKVSPPTTLSSSRSNTNLSVNCANGKAPPVPPRPRLPSSQSNRYSISVCPYN